MSTSAKMGASILWKGDSRRIPSGQSGIDFCFSGSLCNGKITGLHGTVADIQLFPPGGPPYQINSVPLDATQTNPNSYSVIDQTT